MDIEQMLTDLIPENMAKRGRITLDAFLAPLRDIMNRRKFPETPFSESQVDMLIQLLSSMDTDKDPNAARVGEREGRVVSPFMERFSSGFNHGIGRSGHLTEPQPKAAGASLMQQIANRVSLDAIRSLGLPNIRAGIVAPLSTGMSIAMILAALRKSKGIRHVLYPRIDHRSPTKGIAFAGLEATVIQNRLEGDAVVTDLDDLENVMKQSEDFALLITTSFFPPRESDPAKEIAKLCSEHDVPLIINNAYGVQSGKIMEAIRKAIDAGRVDAIVQSSDKNFLTPVGGTIIVSPDEQIVDQVATTYAGRATASPVLQTLVSLLLLGKSGYESLRDQQTENRAFLEKRLNDIAESLNQRLLKVDNPIACMMTLEGLDARNVGARLYNRRVTGPRAVVAGEYGSCIDDYPHNYIVMNAAIGARKSDIEQATMKLYKEVSSSKKKP